MRNKMRKIAYSCLGQGNRLVNRIVYSLQKSGTGMTVFNTAMNTDNLGDHIIMHYCRKFLSECFPNYPQNDISTHCVPSEEDEQKMQQTKYRFVCGTNLLTSHIEQWWNWLLPDGWRAKSKYRNVVLLGVGWVVYQDECSDYSRMIYRTMLNPNMLHSVRDQYTLSKLQQAGFRNVINTGCPTTWALTPEFCLDIPTRKAKTVVATIIDYRRDPEKDNEMLEILSRNYDHIYLWLQGRRDEEYLQTLNIPINLTTIPASLEAYEEVLRKGGVDYVGTRLHAGIHALNYKIRSIILAVDNRATEMGRDVNLPVIQRDEIGRELEKKIQSDFATEIRIKQENIDKFKAQFQTNRGNRNE